VAKVKANYQDVRKLPENWYVSYGLKSPLGICMVKFLGLDR
jgi:hypothetical protein